MENNEVKVKRFKDPGELVHVWANQGEPAGDSKTTPLKFDGPWLSYGGTLLGYVNVEKNFAVINSDYYEHGGWGGDPRNNWRRAAQGAVQHSEVFSAGENFLRWMKDNRRKPERGYGYGSVIHTADDVMGWLIGRALKIRYENDSKAKKAKARRYWIMYSDLRGDMQGIRDMLCVLTVSGKVDKDGHRAVLLRSVLDTVGEYTQEELAAAKAWSDKWEKVDRERVKKHGAFGRESWEQRQARHAQRERERLKQLAVTGEEWTALVESRAEMVRQWKDGANVQLPGSDGYYASYYNYTSPGSGRYVVRSKGDQAVSEDWRAFPVLEHQERTLLACRAGGTGEEPYVVTSRDARVPVRQAVVLLRLVERVRASGVDYVVGEGDGEKHKFGYYSLEGISKDGDVRIGCHTITWEVIEEFRPRLLKFWEGLVLKKEIVGEEYSVEATQR